MSTPAARSTPSKPAFERRVAGLFGLKGDNWLRHANPLSVWTRFAVVPLLALAIWSRVWIGWWSLAAVAAVLAFMMVNPLLFGEPRSTRNWVSKSVFGERIWSDRDKVELPAQFRASKVPNVTTALQVAGLAVMAYGLVELDWLAVVSGVLAQTAKAWFLDRMVLLFEDLKARDPEYAAWER
ncbi:MAG: hypothetical protein K0S88_6006 [Actinomycetia bacterium]|nr:hypothetical protein [Actinomycetes bacterium]